MKPTGELLRVVREPSGGETFFCGDQDGTSRSKEKSRNDKAFMRDISPEPSSDCLFLERER